MLKTSLLRLIIILTGMVIYLLLNQSWTEATSRSLMAEASLYFSLMLTVVFVTGFMVEMAPFKQRISIKHWQALLPVIILSLLIVLTNPYWFFGDMLVEYGVSLMGILPMVSVFTGVFLARALSGKVD